MLRTQDCCLFCRDLLAAFQRQIPKHFGHFDHVTHEFGSALMTQIVDLAMCLCQTARARMVANLFTVTSLDAKRARGTLDGPHSLGCYLSVNCAFELGLVIYELTCMVTLLKLPMTAYCINC